MINLFSKDKMSKILFENQISKLKNKKIANWLLDFFILKNFIIRFVSFIIILLICNILFFVLRENALNNMYDTPHFNKGVGLSIGHDWPIWSVYLLKIIISLIFILISFVTNKWYLYIPFFVVGVNSWLNIIDKTMVDVYMNISYYDTVVDYFKWNWGFTNNIADTLIVIFICIAVVSMVYEIYKIITSKEEKKEQDNE